MITYFLASGGKFLLFTEAAVLQGCFITKDLDSMKDGKNDSSFITENWMFNKEGKIARILSYQRKVQKTYYQKGVEKF